MAIDSIQSLQRQLNDVEKKVPAEWILLLVHLKDALAAILYRSFLGPGSIPDLTDFLYKLWGKRKHFPVPEWYILAQQPYYFGYMLVAMA